MGFHATYRPAPRAAGPFFPCRRLSVCLLVAAAAAALGGGCGRGGAAPARSGPPATVVQIAAARQAAIEDSSEYIASIQSMASTLIKPEVSGELTRIFVRSGDRVAAGARLFQIDPRRQEASVTTQDAALAAQQSAATLALQELDRSKTLFTAGAISRQQLDQAQAAADSAQSQLAAQRARLQQERVTLQYYEVRAPAEGVVGDIPVRVGLHVTTDTTLTSIDRNQELEVNVRVPLERARDLRAGLLLRIVDGEGRPLADSRVFFVSPRVDDQTQSVLVKGRVSGPSAIRSEQVVRARIVWGSSNGLVVPLLSVVRVNGQPFVFVAREDNGRLVAEQRLVTLGEIVGNDVAIKGGLQPNERVVVSGMQKLVNGMPIRPA